MNNSIWCLLFWVVIIVGVPLALSIHSEYKLRKNPKRIYGGWF